MRYGYRGRQQETCRRGGACPVEKLPVACRVKSEAGPCPLPAQRSPTSPPGSEDLLLTAPVRSVGVSRKLSPSPLPSSEDTYTEDSGYSSQLLLHSFCSADEDSTGEDPGVKSSPDRQSHNREPSGEWFPADRELQRVRGWDSGVVPPPEKDSESVGRHLLPALEVGRAVCRSVTSSRGKLGVDQTLLGHRLLAQNLSVENLIGRKMGLDQVDILRELSLRDLKHVLWKVLRFLTEDDVLNCSKVSRLWKRVVVEAKKAGQITIKSSRRRKGSGADHPCDVGSRRSWTRRGTLLTVQPAVGVAGEKAMSFHRCPARLSETPVPSRRSERCQEVVRTLRWDEAVRMCPQCGLAARYLPHQQRATCSSKTCGFDFCQRCFGQFHGSGDCSFRPLGSGARLQPLPGSRGSKHNLRRL
ncbi:F-box only protein 5 [Callorhinchus milii]|uniref:F-box only protein 5 n=1 Tax=Callorhinchus milii TaxID=7868 RepID=UPI001C3F5291|nr:F-box only protein 5 [Callorhinchus milii]